MTKKPHEKAADADEIPAEELDSALIMTAAVVPTNAEDELRREAARVQQSKTSPKRRPASAPRSVKPASKAAT